MNLNDIRAAHLTATQVSAVSHPQALAIRHAAQKTVNNAVPTLLSRIESLQDGLAHLRDDHTADTDFDRGVQHARQRLQARL